MNTVTVSFQLSEESLDKVMEQVTLNNTTLELFTQERFEEYLIDIRTLPVDRVVMIVAIYFNTTPGRIKEHSRLRNIVVPRQVCMFYMHHLLGMSFTDIGKYFNKNHATVMYALQAVENLKFFDRSFKGEMYGLDRLLNMKYKNQEL